MIKLFNNLFIAQLNPTVGDIYGNSEKIITAYRSAVELAAGGENNLIIATPELSLIGYQPEDLILYPEFRAQAIAQAKKLAAQTSDAGLIFGTVWEEKGQIYNAAIFACNGKIRHIHYKTVLPNYGVFDEKRLFSAGDSLQVFEYGNSRLAMMICEDIWHDKCALEAAKQQAEMIIVINASPFEIGKMNIRKKVVATAAQLAHSTITYVNMVGGQDEIVFDGGSFVVNQQGYVTFEAPRFASGIYNGGIYKNEICKAENNNSRIPQLCAEQEIWEALKLGLADYTRKNGFKAVLLGLSGGIDSSVTAAIAVDALGAENVRGVLLPSPYTSDHSNEDAIELANNLRIKFDIIPIAASMAAMEKTLAPLINGDFMKELAVGGNIQARIRGQILMALSNQSGAMLLSTGNKSEIAVGYSTLYGDSCGGYNVLKDVYKTQVYALAEWKNKQYNTNFPIPLRSIKKAPTAELKPGQLDSDQLPEYALLDQILALHIEGSQSAAQISQQGFDKEVVKKIINMVKASEYKRRQSCPGVKISAMMFGRDRRFPLTNLF